MDSKLNGEELLRQSGAKYTIIRPGGLTTGPGGKEELKIGAQAQMPLPEAYLLVNRSSQGMRPGTKLLWRRSGLAHDTSSCSAVLPAFPFVQFSTCNQQCLHSFFGSFIPDKPPNTGQGDEGSPGRVSRADVAAVALAALEQSVASNRKTIELSSKPTDAVEADQLQHVFDGTKADA